MDDDLGDFYPRKVQKTDLSDNMNTVRDRKRRIAIDDETLAADKRRKANNESYRRARNVVKKQSGFEEMTPTK